MSRRLGLVLVATAALVGGCSTHQAAQQSFVAASSAVAPRPGAAPPVLVASEPVTSSFVPPIPPVEVPDPNEERNRAVFEFNVGFNQAITRPIAAAYRTILPGVVRERLNSGFDNLNEPTIFVNAMLQGRFKVAEIALARFVLNSTIGLGGLFDVAADNGLPKQVADFGQTLYIWGAYDSPYVVAPIFGPSTIRDGIGQGVDAAANAPLYGIGEANRIAPFVIGGVSALDKVGDLENVEETSIEYYVRLRNLYWQQRRSELLEAIGRTDPSAPTAAPAGTAFDPVPAPMTPPARPAAAR
ncbi:MAG: VacJ family lipoprotein [Methylobacteriaceae bacterium]|nr:VacJ family lipoprotein [Methylobacteriaceae bacterium]